jgi:hypothetical protein
LVSITALQIANEELKDLLGSGEAGARRKLRFVNTIPSAPE